MARKLSPESVGLYLLWSGALVLLWGMAIGVWMCIFGRCPS